MWKDFWTVIIYAQALKWYWHCTCMQNMLSVLTRTPLKITFWISEDIPYILPCQIVILHGFALVWYFLVLSCIDTVEVTLSDWRDTTLVLERLISEKFGTDRYSDEANVICYLFGVPVCPFSFNCIIVICNPCLDGIIFTLDKIQKPTFRSRAFWSFTSDTHSSMFRWFLPWNQGHNQGFASARYSTCHKS